MNQHKFKRMAADIFGVGESKIWIDPAQLAKVKEAMTRDDIRKLIAERVIRKRKDHGHSRGSARILQAKKALGRRKGPGKRTGTQKARMKPKQQWISRVRALRKALKTMKSEGKVTDNYGTLYKQVKGNLFRGKKHLETVIGGGK
ncbi:MAG: 50S ribosomal protein L19e [Candidatus Iainarchaeum archaeon]|uniref:50S ribosomal protein L19e n=1 Tax=Candidatus Iainarchaeum sp. TaxID=3101447 RepID=A0A7T9DKG1_9ARCH|nr:MAG: 50S ribosomal protein L19e [Candidatus Diapherotrites archaeon]